MSAKPSSDKLFHNTLNLEGLTRLQDLAQSITTNQKINQIEGIKMSTNRKKHQGEILVVDDTPATLKLLTDILSDQGYKVRSATGGQQALDATARRPPELILLDIKMPGMDGYEVCRRLKTLGQSKLIPVIFISGLGMLSDRVKGFEVGGVDYITKPYQREEVLVRVRTHLQLHKMQVNLEALADERTHELMQASQLLQENNKRLTALINASPDIICFKDGKGRWLLANEADLQLFQLAGVDYIGKTDAELAPYSAYYRDAFLACMETDEETWRKGELSRGEERIPIPDGEDKIYDIVKIPLFQVDGTRQGLVVLGHDITELLKTEKSLRQEIAARQQASEVMEEKTKELEEANIALRVLLNQQKDVAGEVQQCVLTQLEKAVLPYITLLRQSPLGGREKKYLDIITDHIRAVGSSFIKKLSNPTLGLTKKEILVADMVRQGRKTKEIAELLNIQPPSVETYRNRIRKKLQLNKKRITLHQYLNATFFSD